MIGPNLHQGQLVTYRSTKWGRLADDLRSNATPVLTPKPGFVMLFGLGAAAAAILMMMAKGHRSAEPDEIVLLARSLGLPVSNGMMAKANKQVALGTTVHGWRSTFRDWTGETTAFGSDVCEAALAHIVGNKVQRGYRDARQTPRPYERVGGGPRASRPWCTLSIIVINLALVSMAVLF